MTIIPDTKDWTWVLRRPCPECGLDTGGFPREAVPEMIMTNAAAWQDLLTGPADTGTRPAPGRWSALEYGCHVRDVFRIFDERLGMMLTLADRRPACLTGVHAALISLPGPGQARHSGICPVLRSRLPTDTGFPGNRRPCPGVPIDVTETSSRPSVKRRAFLGVAAGGVAAVAVPRVAEAAVSSSRSPVVPAARRSIVS